MGRGNPVVAKYERVTFDAGLVRVAGKPLADLLAPGHPLMDAVVALTCQRLDGVLREGSVLVDEEDLGTDPRVLVYLEHAIADGRIDRHGVQRIVSRRVEYVELLSDGTSRPTAHAPYLDYRPVNEDEAAVAARVLDQRWLTEDLVARATDTAIEHAIPVHLAKVRAHTHARVERTRRLVRQRLLTEINNWDARARELRLQVEAGKDVRRRPEEAERIASELADRLDRRVRELDLEAALDPKSPLLAGAALILPRGLLERELATDAQQAAEVEVRTRNTAEVERRAVDAVLATEERLGRSPTEMPHNNPGFDIRSEQDDGHVLFIEVKGRIAGSRTVTLTYNEVMLALNTPERQILALVEVHPDGTDTVRYVRGVLAGGDGEPMFGEVSRTFDWKKLWDMGEEPA